MGTPGNIFALFAVALASVSPGPPSQEADAVWVMVAARDLHPGVPISEEDLFAISVPAALVPDGVFLDPELVVGQRVHERVLVNEMVRAERLADPRNGRGLNAWIPSDMRAVTVPFVDESGLLGSFHRPGDYIDVKVTLPREETYMLLQAVLPLGFSKSTDPGVSFVTLLVTPENAEQVVHGAYLYKLELDFRGLDCGWYYETPPDMVALRNAMGWTGAE